MPQLSKQQSSAYTACALILAFSKASLGIAMIQIYQYPRKFACSMQRIYIEIIVDVFLSTLSNIALKCYLDYKAV